VYKQMDWLEEQATAAGIKVWRVSQGDLRDDALVSQVRGVAQDGKRWASLPYFVLGPDGERGQIRRQCTYEYKIRPIERCLRRNILGLKPRQRAPKTVTVRRWYGISLDEMKRMRTSDNKWAVNYYPLVELRMTRTACHKWLHEHGYHEAPRSACIGCPYRKRSEWQDMYENRPDEWHDAVAFDKAIRKCGGMRGDVFIHSDRIPLEEVNLYKNVDANQLPLWEDECSVICGV